MFRNAPVSCCFAIAAVFGAFALPAHAASFDTVVEPNHGNPWFLPKRVVINPSLAWLDVDSAPQQVAADTKPENFAQMSTESFVTAVETNSGNPYFIMPKTNTIKENLARLEASDAPQITAAIPEPETYALMLAGLGLVGWVARRRQR